MTNPYELLYQQIDEITLKIERLLEIESLKVQNEKTNKPISYYVFIEDVESILKMAVSTIRYHIKNHQLPCYGTTKPLRFKIEEVLTWFEQYSKNPKILKRL